MFLGSNAIEQGAAGKERRLGGWFRRRLNLSTEQVISAMFSTVDWLGDAALAWQTSQNRHWRLVRNGRVIRGRAPRVLA